MEELASLLVNGTPPSDPPGCTCDDDQPAASKPKPSADPIITVPPVVPPPSPPATPPAGDYVNGTTVSVVDGVTTLTPVLYALPNPGGDIGWNSITKGLYIV